MTNKEEIRIWSLIISFIFLVLGLLWLEFKFYSELVPIALVVGLIVAALISGMAISDMDKIKIDNKE